MSYVVLARRWRPKHFSELIGQEHVARTLSNAITQDRVAHAFLFCGPRGVGKTSAARILAKALNCAEGPTPKPCYQCASCREVGEGSSVDVIEIDGASNRGVGEIRELRENVRYAPSRDRLKVYIIDEVHMLTSEAFNALLKTLEEPPAHVKFIFATTEPRKIPITILSRCQRFDFKRIAAPQIAARLAEIAEAEGIVINAGALAMIARQADGGMRDALSLTDQVISFCEGAITDTQVSEVLGLAGRATLFRLSEAIVDRQVEAALTVLDEVNQGGYDLVAFAGSLVGHFRDLAVAAVATGPRALTELSPTELARAQQQAAKVGLSTLTRMFNILVEAAEAMARSSYGKLLFEMTLLKLTSVEPLIPLEPLVQRLEAMESGVFIGDLPGPSSPAGPTPTAGPEATTTPEPVPTPARQPVAAAPSSEPPVPGKPDAPSVGPTPIKPETIPTPPAPSPPAAPEAPTTATFGPAADNPPPPADSERPAFDTEAVLPVPPAPPAQPSPPTETRTDAPESPPTPRPRAEPAVTAHDDSKIHKDALAPERTRETWRAIIADLRGRRPLVAEMYQQASIVSIAPGQVSLLFDEGFSGIADKSDYVAAVADASRESQRALHNGTWDIVLRFVTHEALPTDPLTQSLAFERRAVDEARRQAARHLIATDDVVVQATALFSPKSTRVVLDEDDSI